ncbi:MAG: polyprenyl synthetase family protein [Sandaracinaceae bacterium]
MPTAATAPSDPPVLLTRLRSLVRGRDLGSLAERLADLADLVGVDMVRFEADLPSLRPEGTAVERASLHLVDQGGKRLRPICVALATRLGTGFDERGLDLAIAVELVHAATLLHDDVVDLGETRRGAPAARMIFGNAVSIFAGDWLLIDALRRVRRAGVDGTLDRLLAVIEEMIFAESLQLERRGRLDTTIDDWFEVVEGKTAALFRWAMFAGAKAGGLDADACASLERYGNHLGVAFQATDDLLDLTGDPEATGKALFADLGEGKLTYPLIHALRRSPELEPELRAIIDGATPPERYGRVLSLVEQAGSFERVRDLALEHAERARLALTDLPPSRARQALETVAAAVVHRPA